MYKLITNSPKTVGNMSDNTPLKLLALQKRSKCISSPNKATEVKVNTNKIYNFYFLSKVKNANCSML